ncbi:TRAP transporter large permease [Brucella gallinifaecis]|uniref:TRAP transporter large permease n=1 Tax=Brucella gallinifaecis TaxID=215590 RepID=UPI002361FD09|nr:TRAP transporter large permease [Brucella gallinifaecis]
MGSFFGIFAVMLITGVPIALALGVGGMAYLWFAGHGAIILALPQRMMAGVDQFILMAIPLFLLAGMLMNFGGITDRIVNFARAMIGHRRGGMSSVTVASAGMFAGISGSATAEAAALGSILIPAMKKQGMPPAYAAALIAIASIMGSVIPPSITLIIYGVLSGTSIGALFLAGVVPGVLLGVGLLLYGTWRAHRDGFPISPKTGWAERGRAFRGTLPALILPLIIIVGIRFGVFTPTEAAAVAVVYALFVGALYRSLTWERVWHSLIASAVISASVLFITAMASIVSFVFTLEHVPATIAAAVLQISENPIMILLLLNLVLLILGMFLEPISILILTMPILLQFQQLLGMDPVQFGTMVVLNTALGMATPPVGVLLFIVAGASGEPLIRIIWETLPMIAVCLLVLAIIIAFPGLTLILV